MTASPDELEKEIAENMWIIGVSEELAGAIAPEEVQAFLQHVKRNRREQLAQREWPGGLRYYLWHDAQAGQLRFTSSARYTTPCRSGPLSMSVRARS